MLIYFWNPSARDGTRIAHGLAPRVWHAKTATVSIYEYARHLPKRTSLSATGWTNYTPRLLDMEDYVEGPRRSWMPLPTTVVPARIRRKQAGFYSMHPLSSKCYSLGQEAISLNQDFPVIVLAVDSRAPVRDNGYAVKCGKHRSVMGRKEGNPHKRIPCWYSLRSVPCAGMAASYMAKCRDNLM